MPEEKLNKLRELLRKADKKDMEGKSLDEEYKAIGQLIYEEAEYSGLAIKNRTYGYMEEMYTNE